MKDYNLIINDNRYNVKVEAFHDNQATLIINGTKYSVEFEQTKKAEAPKIVRSQVISSSLPRNDRTERPKDNVGPGVVKAPIPGLIMEIMVKEGDDISAGADILKMEAMKMENTIQAPISGVVEKILVTPQKSVLEGDILLIIRRS